MRKPWWLPEGWHAETWVCSMRGHVLPPATDDERLARGELMRCLRCDTWVPGAAVDEAAQPVPWPRRGKELHQAIVLRLVAIDRAFHAVILIPVGLVLGWLWLRLNVLSPEARALAQSLARVSNDVGHLGGQLNSAATKVASLRRDHVRNLAALALTFGIVEGVEAVGLWRERRWAEYLTVVATASLLPLEIVELTRQRTAGSGWARRSGPASSATSRAGRGTPTIVPGTRRVTRVIGFVINIAVVVYLVRAKRLFGVGGGEPEDAVDRRTIIAASNPQKARPATPAPPERAVN